MIYASQEDCKSALGKRLQCMRTDRPDEWTMDEFIREAEIMAETIRKLEFMVENGLGYEDLQGEI